MGHAPPRTKQPPPTRESYHLGLARRAYLEGDLDVEAFERAVEHVLLGGVLGPNLELLGPARNGWLWIRP